MGRARLLLSPATRLAVMFTSAPVVAGPSETRCSSYRPRSPDTQTAFQEGTWQEQHGHPPGCLLCFCLTGGETEAQAAHLTRPRVIRLVHCQAGIQTGAWRTPNHMLFPVSQTYLPEHEHAWA